jgi:hypothetical protein
MPWIFLKHIVLKREPEVESRLVTGLFALRPVSSKTIANAGPAKCYCGDSGPNYGLAAAFYAL